MKKRRDLKILFSSNGLFSNSGYGVFTQMLLCRMIEDGWNVAHIAFWGLEGHDIILDLGQFHDRFKGLNIKVYPRMNDVWGGDAMVEHGKDFGADVTFAMQDIWAIHPQFLSQIKNFIPYFPIDKDPAPNLVTQQLNYAYRAITFSKFGHNALTKSGWASSLILEGTDTSLFKPLDKLEARKKLNLRPDIFIFAMIAANKENPPRKGWQEALEAFAKFAKVHDDAYLYIKIQQQSPTGFPIMPFAHYLGIADRLIFPDQYTSIYKGGPKVISIDYNAADVLLHPSQTEGFGLTVIEAASCGTPAIVANNTSQPEMVIEGKTGWIANCIGKRFTADNSFVETADPNSIYEKMELAYKVIKKDPRKIFKNCRGHIIKNYNLDTIYKEKWVPLLEKIQEEVLPKKAVDIPEVKV